MKLPLEVIFREMVPLPSLEPEVRHRAKMLERFGGELMSCRVVIEAGANRRRQGHEYQVTVDVRVPDGEIVVSRHHRGDDALLALRAAFEAMGRCLDERARQRRDGPRHVSQPTGAAALGDRERFSEDEPSGDETLQVVEREIGVAEWIDAATEAPVAGQSPPRSGKP